MLTGAQGTYLRAQLVLQRASAGPVVSPKLMPASRSGAVDEAVLSENDLHQSV